MNSGPFCLGSHSPCYTHPVRQTITPIRPTPYFILYVTMGHAPCQYIPPPQHPAPHPRSLPTLYLPCDRREHGLPQPVLAHLPWRAGSGAGSVGARAEQSVSQSSPHAHSPSAPLSGLSGLCKATCTPCGASDPERSGGQRFKQLHLRPVCFDQFRSLLYNRRRPTAKSASACTSCR
jgi:hypothetical protein